MLISIDVGQGGIVFGERDECTSYFVLFGGTLRGPKRRPQLIDHLSRRALLNIEPLSKVELSEPESLLIMFNQNKDCRNVEPLELLTKNGARRWHG